MKPDPSHLATVLKALNVKGDEAIVVGDSVADMRSAKMLNMQAVGLATDSDKDKKLNRAGATQLIKSITELPSLITRLSGNKPQ